MDNIRHPHVEECVNAFLSAVFLIYPKVPVTVISGGLEGTVLLAASPFNSFNTEENRAPLANRAAKNSAVNLDCGGK